MAYSHHLAEDDLAFPYFKKIIPHAPYDRLHEDHQQIVVLLDQIQSAGEAAPLRDHPKENLAEMNQEFAQHSASHSGPDYLVVPFMLYNLAPDDRAAKERELPPIVTKQLIPFVWNKKWKSIQPFLLSD